jgi:Fur family ferric uptake transcriptional regulator
MGIVRKTKSVMTVLNVFEQTDYAVSAVNLVEHLQQKMNKTTVYRILEKLEDQGTLHSFLGKDGLKWYAKCDGCSSSQHIDSHPHFQCQGCGKTECISSNVSVPIIPNHKVNFAELLLTGLCEVCS